MSKIIPAETSNRVVIKQYPAEQKFGGLIIPETARDKPLIGEVVAVSEFYNCPKSGRVEPMVKVGDIVEFENHVFINIEFNGEEHVMIRECNIYLVR
jgi:chaperonin GroES